MARYDLTDFEWSVIEPLLRRSPAGFPGWMIAGFCWVLRSGAPWADLPGRYGPPATCYNRFRRWTKAGIWDRMMDAMTEAYDGDIQMIDGTSVRVHHSAATLKKATQIVVWAEVEAD